MSTEFQGVEVSEKLNGKIDYYGKDAILRYENLPEYEKKYVDRVVEEYRALDDFLKDKVDTIGHNTDIACLLYTSDAADE